MLIQDGRTGNTAQVDAKFRLQTKAVALAEVHDQSDGGNTYSWASGTYNYTGGDTILLIKNTGNDKLDIQGVWLSSDTDTRVVIHLPTSTVTVTGTTVTGTNWNTGSANTASVDAAQDETNNSQGDIIWSGEIFGAQSPVYLDFLGALVLAKNKSLGVDYVTTGTACDVTIWAFFD